MNELRQRLCQRRRELLHRYQDELERVEEELAARDVEVVEQSSEDWDVRVLSSLAHTDIKAIAALNDAIARVDAGTYGVCVHCGERISVARLEALPEATACIDCASIRAS